MLRILDAKKPEPQDMGPGSSVYDLYVSGALRGTSRLRENILGWAREYAAEGLTTTVSRGNVQVATTQDSAWKIIDVNNVWFPDQPPSMLGKQYRSEDAAYAALRRAGHSYDIPGGWRVVEMAA